MLVVLDTNVIVSGLISPHGAPAQEIRAWEDQAFELVISLPLLIEYRRVLGRDRIRNLHNKNDNQLDEHLSNYMKYATLIEIVARVEGITSSPADDMVLATAVSAEADFLVTGDRRFRTVGSYEGVNPVTPNEFLEILQSS